MSLVTGHMIISHFSTDKTAGNGSLGVCEKQTTDHLVTMDTRAVTSLSLDHGH